MNEWASAWTIAKCRFIPRNTSPARTEKNGSIAVEASSCVGLKTEASDRPSWIEMTRPDTSTAWKPIDRMKPSDMPMISSTGAARMSGIDPAVAPAVLAKATARAAARPNLTNVGIE